METRVFRTNLDCEKCVSKAGVFLDADQAIARWSVQMSDKRKLLSVTGTVVNPEHIRSAVKNAGFEVFEEIQQQSTESRAPVVTTSASADYKSRLPLVLVFVYIIAFALLYQLRSGHFEWMSMMNAGMAGFFVVFSFFKLFDIRAFADAYGNYDLLAKRFHVYGYIYPFIELSLGISYFMAFATLATNIANFAVMSVSTIGVAKSVLKKIKIRCACLGTVFNLPMSIVTLIEDLVMVGMSATMIAAMLLR